MRELKLRDIQFIAQGHTAIEAKLDYCVKSSGQYLTQGSVNNGSYLLCCVESTFPKVLPWGCPNYGQCVVLMEIHSLMEDGFSVVLCNKKKYLLSMSCNKCGYIFK